MQSDSKFDYIIAGAGAAGLSLLWRLMNHADLSKKSVLLIDRTFNWDEDKTWCFWNKPDESIVPFVEHTWNKMTAFTHKGELSTSKSLNYYSIRGKRFRQRILSKAAIHPSVQLLEGDIHSFESPDNQKSDQLTSVHTSCGTFKAKHIFQSVIFGKRDHSQPILNQVFHGQFIKTDSPLFNPKAMTLMDFRTGPYFHNQTAFFYVLPFTENYALVEATLFTTETITDKQFAKSLAWYISKILKIDTQKYQVFKTENGSIPMIPEYTAPNYENGIISIGSVAGATKPSTGYTFNRTQEHLRMIIKALERQKKPPKYPDTASRFNFYDHLLVDILIQKPHLGTPIFRDLFYHQPIDRILTFLDEKTDLLTEAKIFARLPWTPFLKAAKHHIFRYKHET